MKKETVKLTVGAMQLVDEGCSASVKFSEDDSEKKKPQLEMVGYSGGIIKGHWYWGDLSIDLAGMKFPKAKFPILAEHDINRKIAFATKMSIEGNQLTVAKAEFIDTPDSLEFRSNSAQGFPYEASIYARPTKIQRLMENEEAEVNGYTMKGPGTIWRASTFKEVSVCTFGYDSNTKSAAMSESEELSIEFSAPEAKLNHKEEVSMDALKFKTDFPDEYAKLAQEITDSLEGKFSEEKKALETQIESLTNQNTQLSADNKDVEKRLLKLEKEDALRAETQLKESVKAVFAEKFKASGLPDRLSDKIKKLVGHEQFVADGVLDTEAFGAALEKEFADWTEGDDSVLGFSTSSKNHGDETGTKLSAECDASAKRMLESLKK